MIVDVVVVTAVLGPSECGGTIRFCVASGELLAVSSIAGIAEPKKTANSGIAGGALARVCDIFLLESKGLVLRRVRRPSVTLESIDAMGSSAEPR